MTHAPGHDGRGRSGRPPFRVRPESPTPWNVAAYAATRACHALARQCGVDRFHAARRLTGWALGRQRLKAAGCGCEFVFPALDGYWSEMFWGGPTSEPDIFALLMRLRDETFGFVDGGANIGYWSALVSGDWFGNHPTVAVEASAETFAWLQKTRNANGRRFSAVHAALYRTAGQLLSFDERPAHAARRIVAERRDTSVVVSTTVDDVAEWALPGIETLVVKLDVEGAEPEALAGAARTRRERDCLFIVEDHGSDDEHRSVAGCLDAGLAVRHLRADGTTAPMPDLAAVARVKTDRANGYNFVAYDPASPLARRKGLGEGGRQRP